MLRVFQFIVKMNVHHITDKVGNGHGVSSRTESEVVSEGRCHNRRHADRFVFNIVVN